MVFPRSPGFTSPGFGGGLIPGNPSLSNPQRPFILPPFRPNPGNKKLRTPPQGPAGGFTQRPVRPGDLVSGPFIPRPPLPPGFEFPDSPERPISPRPGPTEGGGGQVDGPTLEQLLKDLLEENPEIPFASQVNRLGGTGTPQGRFFGSQFENVRNEFLGRLGSQIQGDQPPTLRFTDFLENFDFDRRFRSLAPSLRGQGGTARFRPPTQFRF